MELHVIKDEQHLDLILALDEAVIYKHGPTCWSSMVAHRHVRKFAGQHPDVPVFFVDAVAQRPLSRRIAERLGIRHESPQAIILFRGGAMWDASHYRVTADSIDQNLARSRQQSAQQIP